MSSLGTRYVGDMDRLFDTYAELLPSLQDFFRQRFPKDEGDSDFVYRQAIRAKAFDALRGILPAASLSNVGIYGTGQGYEQLLLRMRAHPLPEARALRRPDAQRAAQGDPVVPQAGRPRRPRRGLEHATSRRPAPRWTRWPSGLFAGEPSRVDGADARCRRRRRSSTSTPTARSSSSRRCSTRTRTCPRPDRGAGPGHVGRRAPRGGAGLRRRPHQPPAQAGPGARAIEYRFDVLADYGAFRDLQRHRMLTIEWQPLSPRHGYTRPEAVDAAGRRDVFDAAMERSAAPVRRARRPVPGPGALRGLPRLQGALRACSSTPVRRCTSSSCASTPQGHPAYRLVAQEMHRLIAEEAGHHAVAEMMRFVDHSPEPALERLDAERRAEARPLIPLKQRLLRPMWVEGLKWLV